MAMPGFDFEAPDHPPVRSGLYDAATVIPVSGTSSVRILEGVRVWPRNCGPTGTWPSDPCAPLVLEVQTVTLEGASEGDFILTYLGNDTDPIAFDATTGDVEDAIEALPGITDVTVTGAPGAWVVTFNDPTGNVAPLVIDDTGTDGTGEVEITTQGIEKGGTRPGPSDLFDPITAWAWDECGPSEPVEAYRARAQHLLDLDEARFVESAFAERLLVDAGVPDVGVSIADGIARLEAALTADGVQGVIHTSPYWTTIAFGLNLIERTGGITRTRRGTAWADGGGYAGVLGNTLVATGQVFIWRGEASVRDAFDYRHNLQMALAERSVLAAYEPCHITAVTVPELSAGGGGGGGGLLYPSP